MIHVFTWYLKEILKEKTADSVFKLGKRLLIIGLMGWILGAIAFNLVGVKIGFVGTKFHYWNRFYNPFIVAIAYGLMMIASQTKYQSNTVNKLSAQSLFIYMFTGNQLLRVYPDNALYDLAVERFGSSMLVCVVFVIAYSLVKFLAGIGISVLYKKTLGVLTEVVSKKECDWIGYKISKLK